MRQTSDNCRWRPPRLGRMPPPRRGGFFPFPTLCAETKGEKVERRRNDVGDVIAGGDFDAAVSRLAAIGYALEDALARA